MATRSLDISGCRRRFAQIVITHCAFRRSHCPYGMVWSTQVGGRLRMNWGRPKKKVLWAEKFAEATCGLTLEDPAKTLATYSIYTDTGAPLPSFIDNRVSLTGIRRLFAAVRKQVKEPKYAVASQASPAPARP